MATIEEIKADAKLARQNLAELEEELQEEIDEIRITAFKAGRPMWKKEKTTRNERRAQKQEARDAFVALALVNLQRLNQSEELAHLVASINQIDKHLAGDLESLEKIERYAETAAAVAEGLGNIASNVAKIVV